MGGWRQTKWSQNCRSVLCQVEKKSVKSDCMICMFTIAKYTGGDSNVNGYLKSNKSHLPKLG
jgi:ribosomal protein S27E